MREEQRVLQVVTLSVIFLLIVLGIVITLDIASEETERIGYLCQLTDVNKQVYDGDTIKDVRILLRSYDFLKEEYGEIWPGIFITKQGIEREIDIRIHGIDTPEKRPRTKHKDGSKRSEASRQREKAASLAARQALIDLLKTKDYYFTIYAPQQGKYAGRIVAEIEVGETDVSEYLIQHGHAKKYDGGTKPTWNFGR